MTEQLEITIRPSGELAYVWDDRLAGLTEAIQGVVTRASHVEPVRGGFTADMGPSGGPVLGPFRLHGEALAAERAWLREHRGL